MVNGTKVSDVTKVSILESTKYRMDTTKTGDPPTTRNE